MIAIGGVDTEADVGTAVEVVEGSVASISP
jgi:hypothetical protein